METFEYVLELEVYFYLEIAIPCTQKEKKNHRKKKKNFFKVLDVDLTYVAYERRQKFITYSCRSRFSGVHLIFEVFNAPGTPIRKILVYAGVLPCIVP